MEWNTHADWHLKCLIVRRKGNVFLPPFSKHSWRKRVHIQKFGNWSIICSLISLIKTGFSLQLHYFNFMSTNESVTHMHTATSSPSNEKLCTFPSHTHSQHTYTQTHTVILIPYCFLQAWINLFWLCLRETGAVTLRDDVQRFDLQLMEKIYFFQFLFCHTRTAVFPTGDPFFCCNNHWDDRSLAVIWAV